MRPTLVVRLSPTLALLPEIRFPRKYAFFFLGFFDFLCFCLYFDLNVVLRCRVHGGVVLHSCICFGAVSTHSRGLTRVFLFSLGININLLKVFRIID